MPFSTCLDYVNQNLPSSISFAEKVKYQGSWGKKQKRCYHRLLSGVKKAKFDNKVLRFMTLTSASPFAIMDFKDFDGYEYELSLNEDFQVLCKRIERTFNVNFEYGKVRTNEGNGVLHILFTGCYIPKTWLIENWSNIHGADDVDIQMVDSRAEDISRHIVSQYMSGQLGFAHLSWSWGWVCRGFVKKWKEIIGVYAESKGLKYCIGLWDMWLMNSVVPDDRHVVREHNREKRLRIRNTFTDGRFWWCVQG